MSKDLSYLNKIVETLEAETASSFTGDGLKINYLGGDAKFIARFVVDSNQELIAKARMYKLNIETVEEKNGKKTKKSKFIRYRAPDNYADDPLAPLATELNYFTYNAQNQRIFFGECVKIIKDSKSKLQTGPCIFVDSKGHCLAELNKVLVNIMDQDRNKADQCLDYNQRSFTFTVELKQGSQGKSGTCSIQPNLLVKESEYHEFPEETKEAFKDITKVFFPSLGEKNDINGKLLEEEYRKRLKENKNYVEPDKKSEAQDEPDPDDMFGKDKSIKEQVKEKDEPKKKRKRRTKEEIEKREKEAEQDKNEPVIEESTENLDNFDVDFDKMMKEANLD